MVISELRSVGIMNSAGTVLPNPLASMGGTRRKSRTDSAPVRKNGAVSLIAE